MHDVIGALSDIDFVLYTLSPRPDQSLRYTLPGNVVGHKDLVLGSDMGKRRQKPATALVEGLLGMHERLFNNEDADVIEVLRAREPDNTIGNGLLGNESLWNLIASTNMKRNPAYAFSDYFWAWQSSHRMIFRVLADTLPAADMYHAISTGFAGLAALNAKARTGKPLVLTEHGLYHKEREIEIRKASFVRGYQRDMWINIYNSISRMCYRNADSITSLFEENRQKQIEMGAEPQRCRVIANGIDVERFTVVERMRKPGFHVGLVGRIVPIKDVKTYIAMARLVLDRVPDAVFYAIGPTDEDPDYYEECVSLTASLGLEHHFTFTGRQDVRDYYSFLDVMVLSSLREAQPLVVLEGWAAGVPSVCTRVGNAPEMLDYNDRLLAPSKDAAGLADAVLYVHDHPAEIEVMNGRNKARVGQHYHKADMMRRYAAVYHDVAEKAR